MILKYIKYIYKTVCIIHVIICVLMSFCISCGADDNDVLVPQNTIQDDVDKGDDNSTSDDKIEGPNLLLNGNLEKWGNVFWGMGNCPEGWSLPSNDYTKNEKVIVYEGQNSVKLQSLEKGVTARLEQKIMVNSGSKIRILFHYFINQWQSKGARTYCYFRTGSAEKYNISAEDLKAFYGEKVYRVIRGGGNNLTYFPSNMNVWQVFDETIEVPPTATYFVFGINSYLGTTIYVDDCYVMTNDYTNK